MTQTSAKKLCRTLIVEDDRTSRDALRKLLALVGHEVAHASTLGDAMTKLSWEPECVILDLMLPDGNGVRLLEQIRRERLPIKVAVTTGANDLDFLDSVARFGPEKIFTKPLDFSALTFWLRSV